MIFERGTGDFEVTSVDYPKFVLCFGTAAHAMHQVSAALSVSGTGRVFPAWANARVALEFAMVAQWILVHPEGSAQYQQLLANKQGKFVRGLHAAGAFPGTEADYEDLLASIAARDSRDKNIQTIFESLEPDGKRIYGVYRQLSQSVHPSEWAADAYLAEVDGKMHLRENADVGDGGGMLYFPLAVAALFALGALESLRVDSRNLAAVNRIAEPMLPNGVVLRPKA